MVIKEIGLEEVWRVRQEVMWPDRPIEFIKLKDDEAGIHFGLFVNNDLKTVVSCFAVDGEMQFRKLATINAEQGKGYASFLLDFIFGKAEGQGIFRVWCNARLNKKSFYEKFGLEDTGIRFSKAEIEFTVMQKFFYNGQK